MSLPIGEPRPDGQRAEEPAADPRESSVLERVLRETLSENNIERMSSEELQALTEVAARYRGADLVLDPIAVELLDASLRFRFGNLNLSEGLRRRVSLRIAATLLEDPSSQQRLNLLWNQLSERVR